MANIRCRLCLNDCLIDNVFDIFDEKLDVNLPELIAKYLLIFIENNINALNEPKICRMCFVHLLDFHYFYKLIEEKQQFQKLSIVEPKVEIIDISDTENDAEERNMLYEFVDMMSEKSDAHFPIIEESTNGVCLNANKSTTEINNKSTTELNKTLQDKSVQVPLPMITKFIYDDDSEPEIIENNIIETNDEQNQHNNFTSRKRKRNQKDNACQNLSIQHTLMKLRRRTRNICDIIDKNGHLRKDVDKSKTREQNQRKEDSTSSEAESHSRRGFYNVRGLKIKKSKIRSKKRDIKTYEIIARHGKLKCDICNVHLNSFRDLAIHFHKKHTDLRPYAVCCDKRHYSPKILSNHILTHSNPDIFRCEICHKVLGTQYSYRIHKKNKHSGKRKYYKCDICGKRLISKKYFDVHVSNHK